jgi:hypothetical protein
MATHHPAATIKFAAVAGEEQGLLGSTHLAQLLSNTFANVEGMWTNDIVGCPVGDDGRNNSHILRLFTEGIPSNESKSLAAQREKVGGENDSPSRQLGRFTREVVNNALTGMRVEMVYRADRYLRGGDHSPFLAAGYPAARFTEPRENYNHQHQDIRIENGTQYGDLPEFCDYYYISRVANAPDTPKDVTVEVRELGNESKLRWRRVGGAVGYEVVWRTTDQAYWERVLGVGDVDVVTVDLSKDNVVFGVRSVGENGYKSPAVFPFPG